MILLFAALPAHAGEFMDVWVTTAFEDTNILAGPDAYSPSANFVERGNQTFFENYDSRFTDDISQSYLVLYRRDEGFSQRVFTEAALVLRFQPFLDPDFTEPGVSITDDGSYVRVAVRLGDGTDDKHNLSITGYAVDANRFRLGYSYDLTWGGRNIFVFDPLAAPGVRVQYQNREAYAFAGVKTAVGDYIDPVTSDTRNQAYYGFLVGGGGELGDHVRLEAGLGSFQQGQLTNVADVASPLYNAPIVAAGASAQIAFRTNPELDYIVSNELRLYRNAPDQLRDTYIFHRTLEGGGLLVQGEVNALAHNLIDPDTVDSTVVEKAFAGDLQALYVTGTTELGADLVYKDLPFIVFNIPGITSGYALSNNVDTSPEIYVRARAGRYLPEAHLTPSVGVGYKVPASYGTSQDGYFVQYDSRNKENVPDGFAPSAILSAVGGLQWDISKSTVAVGEVLYTLDNNQSDFVQTDEEVGTNVIAPANERNIVGFNLMLRARF